MVIKETLIKSWVKVHFTRNGFPFHFCDCGCGKQFAYCNYKRKVYRLLIREGTREFTRLEVRRECDT